MKRKLKIIIGILLGIVTIGLLILLVYYNHTIWLQEYNKQMETLGYYKEDIHLLDQHFEHIKLSLLIGLNIIVGVFSIVIAINGILED